MSNNLTLNDVFNKESIIKRAEESWNFKQEKDRIRAGKKYNHIFLKLKIPIVGWENSFNDLSYHQKVILIKGELIRTYDSLPNKDKTLIKDKFKLTMFSSKWYRLSNKDKNKLLKYIL